MALTVPLDHVMAKWGTPGEISVLSVPPLCSLSQLHSYDKYYLMVKRKHSCRLHSSDFSELLWAPFCFWSEGGCISHLRSWSISSHLAALRTMMDKTDRQKQTRKKGRRDFISQMKKAEELRWQFHFSFQHFQVKVTVRMDDFITLLLVSETVPVPSE